MTELKNESKVSVTTTHVCHWTINVTAIIIVAAIALLVCIFWKYIPTLMDRIAKNQA